MGDMTPEVVTFLALPALPPPSGVTPNFDNPPNQNGLAMGVTTFLTLILKLCFLLRLYARFWVGERINIEEILMIVAYGLYWGTAYAAYSLINAPGYYVHTWDIHLADLVHPLYLVLVYGCCYSIVLPLIKTAILLDWCRVFVPGERLKSPFWWGCIALVTVQSIWSVAIIWSLHMNWQRRLGVSVIFGVGTIGSISACFRLTYSITLAEDADSVYILGPLIFWACAEMTSCFFILSVPCLPALIKQYREGGRSVKELGSSKTSTGPTNSISTPSRQRRSGSHQMQVLKPGMSMKSDPYHKIREEDVSAGKLKPSESQEQLHEGVKGFQVTRETQVGVVNNLDSPAPSEAEDDDTAPWTRFKSVRGV
ncbi:hypothetical protein B0T17DRAFT_508048 [Bombardia bombarda]|uniref:Rhodopsin domain-containing protein n=1 Tax=Bombardia bombarda TaxID=252184 RepID=A0AA40C5H9_9PEZI|nr:hypothetical protein B0T17DRAFT_508048 [Bombardia bombarda]